MLKNINFDDTIKMPILGWETFLKSPDNFSDAISFFQNRFYQLVPIFSKNLPLFYITKNLKFTFENQTWLNLFRNIVHAK